MRFYKDATFAIAVTKYEGPRSAQGVAVSLSRTESVSVPAWRSATTRIFDFKDWGIGGFPEITREEFFHIYAQAIEEQINALEEAS